MKDSRSQRALPIVVRRSLAKLGGDIAIARKRRRLPMQLVAERAFIGRNTLTRVERGDPSVSIGIYATVLFVLGLDARVGDMADPLGDSVGQTLEQQRLPLKTHSERLAKR